MLRVTGGRFRGRRLQVPRGRETRPTADMVREGTFNVLAHRIAWDDADVLDLFAGSGALGIEALSRGARSAVFVESHPRTAALLRGNLAALGIGPETGRVVTARVERWLERPALAAPVSLVLMDPPYAFAGYEAVLARLADSAAVAPGALVVVETAGTRELAAPAGLEPLLAKRYGDTQVRFFARTGNVHQPRPAPSHP